MPQSSDWEPLICSFDEYIPNYGTLYSFRRSYRKQAGDEKECWLNAVNTVQGITREAVLYFELVEPLPVIVIHAMAESLSDRWSELMTDDSHIRTCYKPKGSPKRDSDHINVLITSKTRGDADRVIQNKLMHAPFLSVLRLYRAVYKGKFNHPNYASNENFYMVFPEGLRDEACCYVLSTFSVDAGKVLNRELTNIVPRIRMTSPLRFKLQSPDVYYWYSGTISNQGERILLEMYNPSSNPFATINLERQPKDTP